MDYKKWGILGAAVGFALPWTLSTVSTLVSMIPGFDLNLQAIKMAAATNTSIISLHTNGLTTLVNTGIGTSLGTYLTKLIGVSPIPITGLDYVYTAIGGAAFFILGAFLAEHLHLLKGNKVQKVMIVGVIGGLATTAVLSMALAIPTIGALFASVLSWAILAWVIVKLDELFKLHLVE